MYIRDGMLLTGTVDALPLTHGKIRFKFRPAGYAVRAKINAAFTAEQKTDAVVEIICEKVTEIWETNPDGTETQQTIDPVMLKELCPTGIIETMIACIVGQVAPSLEAEAGK